MDEIGELPLAQQAHLLRFIETGEARAVGDPDTQRFDVRIVSATNRSLAADVAERRFRADLYFRLAVLECHIPPLRERREDIEPLVFSWLPDIATHMRAAPVAVDPMAMAVLKSQEWPGNVRQLRHVLERAICFASDDRLTVADVVRALQPCPSLAAISRSDERERTLAVLAEQQGNRTRAARELGVDRTTLLRRLRKYGLTTRR
jgi:DNA-binding NtrC family response regulator